MLQDIVHITNLEGPLQIYPPEALIDGSPDMEVGMIRKIADLDPLKTAHNSAAVLIPTKLSHNIALMVGLKAMRSGLPDISRPWLVMISISENVQLENAWFDGMALQPHNDNKESANIKIDEVGISALFTPQPWSTRSHRAIVVSCVSLLE
jgi:hypothetical protein